jgi:hypothetical protein
MEDFGIMGVEPREYSTTGLVKYFTYFVGAVLGN